MTRAAPRSAQKAAAARPAAPARPSGDELLEQISPTKRREGTWICLRADLLDEWHEENETLQSMRAEQISKSAARLASSGAATPAVKAQARKVQKLEAQIEAAQMHFVFENMSPDEHSAMAASYPPRKGNQFDMLAGYDREAVSRESVRACLVEPEFSDDGWDRLMAVIPPGEWSELVSTCDKANGRVASLPKSGLAASLLRSKNGTSSAPPESGE